MFHACREGARLKTRATAGFLIPQGTMTNKYIYDVVLQASILPTQRAIIGACTVTAFQLYHGCSPLLDVLCSFLLLLVVL